VTLHEDVKTGRPSGKPAARGGSKPTGTGLSCDPARMAAALEAVRRDGAAAVPVLPPEAQPPLVAAAEALSFRPARPVVGAAGREVQQDFTLCDRVSLDGLWGRVTAAVNAAVNAGLAVMDTPPIPALGFNEVVIQHYRPVSCGISPHRDHVRYVHLVGLLILYGEGDFYICPDRSGADARLIPAGPGDLLLMRAPGFDDSRHRPFHMLGEVRRARLIVGLREDTRPGTTD